MDFKLFVSFLQLLKISNNTIYFVSYPAVVVIPSRIIDDTIMKVSKNHRLNRFPVVVWSHRRTKGALLRSGAISKSVLTSVLRGSLSNQTPGYNNSNITEDEKLFSEIGKKNACIFLT